MHRRDIGDTVTDSAIMQPAPEGAAMWRSLRLGVLLAAVCALIGSAWGIWLLLPNDSTGAAADIGFARDMSAHHAQAVEMALIARDRTQDEEIRILATDILLTQQGQIGQMQGWLAIWGVSSAGSEPRMSWMGHPVEGRMPGMASPEEIAQLGELPPNEADAEFLRLMIPHHQAGIEMAEELLERSERGAVRRLAQAIATSQEAEIELMQGMLMDRGFSSVTAEVEIDAEEASGHGELAGHRSADTLPSLVRAAPLVVAVVAIAWLILDTWRTRTGRLTSWELEVWPDPIWQVVAAAGLFGSAVIHAALTPAHFDESTAYGIFFVCAALAAAIIAGALLAWPSASVYAAGLVISVTLIAVYVLFRIVPPPGASTTESIDVIGLSAKLTEVAGAVACAALWSASRQRSPAVGELP